ncbi:MAG: ROK family protein [Synergistaceae bacterium]|jgi:glucokinase|nr:ROK family protein [Synergistaceae bacterium]
MFMDFMRAVGVDLGGHHVAAGLVEGAAIAARAEERTAPSREVGAVVAQVARLVHSLGASDAPVGICVPGSLDAARERGMMIANFEGWNGLPLRKLFEEALGCTVVIENDANAYALGEGCGMRDYVVLTFGTGIGGGVVVGGRLLIGAHGMAGELGHIVIGREERCGPGCRGLGHFEAICGADALERAASEKLCQGASVDLKTLWGRREEPGVSDFWDAALENFARGVASLVHVFDPEAIVIGGGVGSGEGFVDALRDKAYKYISEPFRATFDLRPSSRGTDAPIFGAASLAWEARGGRSFP